MYISQAWDYLGTQHFGTDILAPYTFQLMYLSCQKTFRCQNKPKPLLTTVFFQFIYVNYNQIITEMIPDCKAIPSNPAACYMAVAQGTFSVDVCESVQGYPPRLTEAGAGKELLSMFAPKSPIWVGLTTTVDK